jgi:hypothetical protein
MIGFSSRVSGDLPARSCPAQNDPLCWQQACGWWSLLARPRVCPGTIPTTLILPVIQFALPAVVHLFDKSHQELPSQSANPSRPDSLPSPTIFPSKFDRRPKNFHSERVLYLRHICRGIVAFGGLHAPWWAAIDLWKLFKSNPPV